LRLTGQISKDGFGGATPAEHCAVAGSVVAVIAADIYAGTNTNRALRRFECTQDIAAAAREGSVAFKWRQELATGPNQFFHLCYDKTTELLIGQLLRAQYE